MLSQKFGRTTYLIMASEENCSPAGKSEVPINFASIDFTSFNSANIFFCIAAVLDANLISSGI